VSKGQVVAIDLVASVPASAGGGPITGTLSVRGDSWEPVGVPLSLLVARMDVTTSPASFTAAQGSESGVDVTLHSIAGPETDVVFTPGVLPGGVTMAQQTVPARTGAVTPASLSLVVGPHPQYLPVGGGFPSLPLSVSWSAYGGQATGSLKTTISVLPVGKTFTMPGPLSSGDVECTWAKVLVQSDGAWQFNGHLHDHGTILGDQFVLGFAFTHTGAPPGFGDLVHGKLGAVLGPSRDLDFRVPPFIAGDPGGEPSWISEHWQEVFAGQVTFRLVASADLSTPVSDLADLAVAGLKAAVGLAQQHDVVRRLEGPGRAQPGQAGPRRPCSSSTGGAAPPVGV
jgi:hypothetical protein